MNPHDHTTNDENHENDESGAEIDATTAREALLTAYALDEAGPAEAQAAEAILARDPAAAQMVDEVRATAALLTTGLAAEASEALPAAARAEIAAAAAGRARPAARVRSIWPLVNAAAAMVAAVGLWAYLEGQRPNPGDVLFARANDSVLGRASGQRESQVARRGSAEVGTPQGAPGDRPGTSPYATWNGVGGAGGAGGGYDELDPLVGGAGGAAGAQPGTYYTMGGSGGGGGRRTADASSGYAWSGTGYQAFSGDNGGAGAGRSEDGRRGWDPYARSGRYDYSGARPDSNGNGVDPSSVSVGTLDRFVGSGGGGGGYFIQNGSGAVVVDGSGRTVSAPADDGRSREAGGGGGGTFAGSYVASNDFVRRDAPAAASAEAARAARESMTTALDAAKRSGDAGRVAELETQLATLQARSAQRDLSEVVQDARVALLARGGDPAQQAAQLRLQLGRLQQVAGKLPKNIAAEVDADGAVQVLQSWLADRENAAAALERGRRMQERLRLRYGVPGTEDYRHPGESIFRDPRDEPLSTFSIDVDTASYTNVRRFLNSGTLPPADAVRVEELVNYFTYTDAAPEGPHPVAATVETATCPWNTDSRLVRIGVKAKELHGDVPPANLVFLIDVSGSMQPADKLPLLQNGLKMLADQMRPQDHIAIVTYASDAGVRLDATSGAEKATIKAAIDGLSAGGSTNGEAGIQTAYEIAAKHFAAGGVNRVILATDGDFNVGMTDQNELWKMIGEKAKGGVFLTVLGVGTGNLKDATMEQLADRGNGSYHYLDGLREARRVLVEDLTGTVVTVAKDVKIQVEWNPAVVGAYRLIGYENRMLAAADFNNDAKDAGEMGAGHAVTALYEIVPQGGSAQPGVDPLRYQRPPAEFTETARSGEMLTLKVRYKLPDAGESTRFDLTAKDSGTGYDEASENLRFASAVAAFGMLLRGSPAAAGTSYDAVLELAQGAVGADPGGRRAEFLDLVLKARTLSGR